MHDDPARGWTLQEALFSPIESSIRHCQIAETLSDS